jgi:hypothetical protein
MTNRVVRAHTDVTPAFLTEVLGASGWIGDAVVVDAPVERIGDGLMGVCARYRLRLDREVSDAPLSVVGKFAAQDTTAREFMTASGYRNELCSLLSALLTTVFGAMYGARTERGDRMFELMGARHARQILDLGADRFLQA